jgi:DNA polymerase
MQGATPHAPATQQPFQLPAAERQKPLPAPLAAEDRLQRMHALAATVASCQQCRLSSTRTQTVFGVGTPLSDVVFVGEGPGAEEDLQGEPFVGAAGKLLDQMLKAIQRQRAEVYIANVVKCRPPGNRNPEDAEMLACHTYLFQQLEIIQPKVIFCLGKFAILCLTGHTGTVSQARENAFVWRGIPVLASFHPAYYLRTPSRRRAAWEDLLRLLARLE